MNPHRKLVVVTYHSVIYSGRCSFWFIWILPSVLQDSVLEGFFMNVVSFAVDTNFILTSSCLQSTLEMVQTLLQVSNIWCNRNRLMLNMAKTGCLVFSSDKSTEVVPRMTDYQVTVSTATKFLSVHLDNHL